MIPSVFIHFVLRNIGVFRLSTAYMTFGKKTAVQDQHTDILSNEGSLLKSWNYADRDAEERQFFNESYWRLYMKKYSHSDELNFTWVFDIYPTDIK